MKKISVKAYYEYEPGVVEADKCPLCGAEIEPYDGADNGYGDLCLWWRCEACGATGEAVVDYHNQDDFYFHRNVEPGRKLKGCTSKK